VLAAFRRGLDHPVGRATVESNLPTNERSETEEEVLLGKIRAIAYLPSRTMTAAEQMGRIRDLLGEHYGVFTDPEDDDY
jgi:hypothetical protein